MIYGYIRVSTDKQNVENQRYEIEKYCEQNHFKVDQWVEEIVSGKQTIENRKLGRLLKRMKRNDIMICAELSRLGRSMMLIMSVLNECMEREIQVWTIKDNYRLGADLPSKVLAFAFGLVAEIERDLISQRTKEALARKKSEGIILGRPKGSLSSKRKLSGHEKEIKLMLQDNTPKTHIAKIFKVHRNTLYHFIHNLDKNNQLQ